METENWITIFASLLAFLASIVAAIVSIYNARFKKYVQQQWWDRKIQAYERVIGALSSLVYYYEVKVKAEEENRELPESRKDEIGEHWASSFSEIKKATAIGSFLISEDAESALQKFWTSKVGDHHPNDWYSRYASDYISAKDCLKSFVEAAKKDVQVL